MNGTREIEVLVDDAVFGESPRWHDCTLWFSDIGGDAVWRIAGDGTRQKVVSSIRMPSGLGWTADGDLLVAGIHDSTIYRVGADGTAQPVCGPDRHGAIGTNDMATFGARSYVSCAGRVFEKGDTPEQISAPVGKIVLFDHDRAAARIVADGYRMPNGIVVTPDGRRLIVSELWESRLLQFDIAPDGSLTNETVFAALQGHADGICIDSAGAIWAAIGGGDLREWQRVEAGGRVTDSIPAPEGYNAIAAWLGGDDGRDLFLVANRMESPDDLFNGKARSRVLRTRVDVPAR